MQLIISRLIFLTAFLNINLLIAGESPTDDSLSLTIEQADSFFLSNNFSLIASKFEISAADAMISQAKLYPNPNLSIDQGAYNHETGKWFDISPTGETAASLQQMIILAGKRNKNINLAKINSKISSYQFFDLIRTLRYQLHESFYSLYFLRQSITVYDKEIESLSSLLDVYQKQYDKGNVSFGELARLQSLDFTLKNERLDILHSVTEKQGDLILLMGDAFSRTIIPVVSNDLFSRLKNTSVDYKQLLDSTLANRYDLKIADESQDFAQANLSLQKSLSVPDITLGANWDRQGSYITNYNSLSLAIDLPFWNRNQGSIRAAEHRLSESKANYSLALIQTESDMAKAYDQFVETQKLFNDVNAGFNDQYEKLLGSILNNYKNHTISLLEFVDYFENYKSVRLQYNELLNKRILSFENLNYVTGTIIFK